LAGYLQLGGKVLRPPKRGGKRRKLSSTIRARISNVDSPIEADELSNGFCRLNKRSSPDSLVAQAVAAKLEDGNIRAAIRILTSDDTPAVPSEESLAKLQAKHPPPRCPPQEQFFLTLQSSLLYQWLSRQ
jgi:hypothetical protein